MTKLTAEERESVDRGLDGSGCMGFLGDHPNLYAAVEAILAARLAPIEALADEYEEREAKYGPYDETCTGTVAEFLRAALAGPQEES